MKQASAPGPARATLPSLILEVRHLRIVEAISRTGTVSGAAPLVNLTQPAISHALGELEQRLRLQLFRRTPHGMELTREGRRVLEAAHVVLEELRAAEHDLGLVRAGETGLLAITTECYTCYHWLPPVLAAFRKDHPAIDVRIVPEGADDPYRFLSEGRADLAIVHRAPSREGILAEELFRDELVAVVAPNHRAARARRIELQDFGRETLVLHSNPPTSTIVTQVLSPAGITPPEMLQLRLTEAVLEFVKAGLGITVLARWAVAPALADGSVVALRVGNAGLFRTWYAAYPERRKGSRALRAFVAQVKEHPFAGAEPPRVLDGRVGRRRAATGRAGVRRPA